MSKLRIGIRGAARITTPLIAGTKLSSRVEVVAVPSRDQAQAKIFSDTHGVPHALNYEHWVTRSILKQLGGEPSYAAQLLTSVANGNLNVEVTTKNGDTSSMLFAVRNMIDRLKQVINGQQRWSKPPIAATSRSAWTSMV